MNITLTVRGTLEDDQALQEIVSILYRKTAAEAEPPELEVEPEPAPKPKGKPAVVVQEPDMLTAKKAEVTFEQVAAAGRKLMNAGNREAFARVLKERGYTSLAQADKTEYPDILAELEALQ